MAGMRKRRSLSPPGLENTDFLFLPTKRAKREKPRQFAAFPHGPGRLSTGFPHSLWKGGPTRENDRRMRALVERTTVCERSVLSFVHCIDPSAGPETGGILSMVSLTVTSFFLWVLLDARSSPISVTFSSAPVTAV